MLQRGRQDGRRVAARDRQLRARDDRTFVINNITCDDYIRFWIVCANEVDSLLDRYICLVIGGDVKIAEVKDFHVRSPSMCLPGPAPPRSVLCVVGPPPRTSGVRRDALEGPGPGHVHASPKGGAPRHS